jgi:hypothetical protein
MGDARVEGTAEGCMSNSSGPDAKSDAEVVSFGDDAADNGGDGPAGPNCTSGLYTMYWGCGMCIGIAPGRR